MTTLMQLAFDFDSEHRVTVTAGLHNSQMHVLVAQTFQWFIFLVNSLFCVASAF